jgi:hypothetical protein
MEANVRDDIKLFCEKKNISLVDALPIFQEAVLNNKQINPNLIDGHPNSLGYFLLASVV